MLRVFFNLRLCYIQMIVPTDIHLFFKALARDSRQLSLFAANSFGCSRIDGLLLSIQVRVIIFIIVTQVFKIDCCCRPTDTILLGLCDHIEICPSVQVGDFLALSCSIRLCICNCSRCLKYLGMFGLFLLLWPLCLLFWQLAIISLHNVYHLSERFRLI